MPLLEIASVSVASGIFTAGVVWGTIRRTLNGTVEDVREIKTDVKLVDARLRDVEQDVSYLKGQHSPRLESR